MRPYIKARPIKDPEGYLAWAVAHGHCQGCGRGTAEARHDFWPGLSTHHLVKPGRSDEPCNLLRLCRRCHDLAEGLTYRVAGVVLPTLPPAVCLTLKALTEPAQWDPNRLLVLWGRASLELHPIPPALDQDYRRRRGPRPGTFSPSWLSGRGVKAGPAAAGVILLTAG